MLFDLKKKKGKEVAPAVEEKPKKKRGMGDQWTKEEHEYVSKTFTCFCYAIISVNLFIYVTYILFIKTWS